MRSTARRKTKRGSPSYGSPSGVTTSQIIRPTFERSPSEYGISWKVVGSGIATMSDSSMALKPVIEEPSKPMPSSSALSISAGVIAKLFRCPSRSVNHRRMKSTPSSLMRSSTRPRSAGSLVALSRVSAICVISPPLNAEFPFKCKKPRASCPRLRRLNYAGQSTDAGRTAPSSGSRPWWRTARA